MPSPFSSLFRSTQSRCTPLVAPTVVTPLGLESLIPMCLILNLHKGLFNIFFFTHFTWFFLSLSPWLVMSRKVEAPFGPKSSGIHPTNSQFVPLPIMGFGYINSLPPINYSLFRPKVGIMAHLVVSDLLIYPFSYREPTHT